MHDAQGVGVAAADALAGPRPAPRAERSDGPKHAVLHAECLNCGEALHGRYCAHCGQIADDHHRSILHLAWEAVEGLTHLDGRLARTVPPLFFDPGRLARDHLEGRRQRHVPPFRLFLVTLLLFMLSMEVVTRGRPGRPGPASAVGAATLGDGVLTVRNGAGPPVRVVVPTTGDLARWSSGEVGDAQIERELTAKGVQAAAPVRSSDAPGRAPSPASAPAPRRAVPKFPVTISAEPSAKDGGSKNAIGDWLGERIEKAKANPEFYKSIVFGWAHRLAVLLLPIFAAQLLILYCYKRRFYVYDHLVVSMQFLSFVFIISGLAWLWPQPVRSWAVGVASLWAPVNLFMLLRGAYGSSRIGAALRTVVLWVSTVAVFGLMLVGLLTFGLQQL